MKSRMSEAEVVAYFRYRLSKVDTSPHEQPMVVKASDLALVVEMAARCLP